MLRRTTDRTRRFLLTILLAIIVIHGLDFFSRKTVFAKSKYDLIHADFMLEVYGEPGGETIEEAANLDLPFFNPQTRQWTVAGKLLIDFVGHVRGLEIGPHGSSPFIIINMPKNASVANYRSAIASLAVNGVCRVGVFSPASEEEYPQGVEGNPDWPPKGFVPVYRVIAVKRENGSFKACKDRFPAFAPWEN